jgi:hypothetical protein
VDFTALNAALSGSGIVAPPPPPDPPPPTTGPRPYSGTPLAVPGTVQFENYDVGGASVGYADTTSGNAGGAYRADNVDIQAAADTGGGFNVGWAKAGEWLLYTVNVATAGTYVIDVRVASSGTGGTLHFEAPATRSGTVSVPNTGGWQMWRTVTSSSFTLAAGPQLLRVRLDTNGPGGSVANLNWFAVRKIG